MRISFAKDVTDRVVARTLNQEVLDATQAAFNRLNGNSTNPGDFTQMLQLLQAPLTLVMTNRLNFLFGSSSPQTLAQVVRVVRGMATIIQRPASLLFTWSKNTDPTNYAHVYTNIDPNVAGSMFIYLDQRYVIAQENGLNNRYLTLVHEFSHLAQKTNDFKYDTDCFWKPVMDNCIPPNSSLPYNTDLAVNNADTYGFLMAATFARIPGQPCPIP